MGLEMKKLFQQDLSEERKFFILFKGEEKVNIFRLGKLA